MARVVLIARNVFDNLVAKTKRLLAQAAQVDGELAGLLVSA